MGLFTALSVPEILVRWVLCVLAVYRVCHAFALETGPFAMFVKIREWVIRRYSHTPEAWQSQFVTCPLCQGFWGAGLASLVVFPMVSWVDTLLIWGSVAGGILVVHLILYR